MSTGITLEVRTKEKYTESNQSNKIQMKTSVYLLSRGRLEEARRLS